MPNLKKITPFPANKTADWYSIKNISDSHAEIHIYDAIGENFWGGGVSARGFLRDLKGLGKVKNLTVRINSPGGNVFDGNAIYNLLKSHDAHVHVIIDGVAASIASIIAMAGDTIEMPENAYMMIHNPINGIYGNAQAMRKMADDLDTIKEGLVATYLGRTGMDKKQISDLMDQETWMTADEAVEMGFADKITEPVKAAANFAMLGLFQNTPTALFDSSSVTIKHEKETPSMATNPPAVAPAPQAFDASSKAFTDAVAAAVAAALPTAVEAALTPAMKQLQDQQLQGIQARFNSLSANSKITPAQAKLFGAVAEQVMANTKTFKFSAKADGSEEVEGTALDALFALADSMNHTLLNEQVGTGEAKPVQATTTPAAVQTATAKGWTPDLTDVPEDQAGCLSGFVMDQFIRTQVMAKNPTLKYAEAAAIAEKDVELRKLLQEYDNGYKSK